MESPGVVENPLNKPFVSLTPRVTWTVYSQWRVRENSSSWRELANKIRTKWHKPPENTWNYACKKSTPMQKFSNSISPTPPQEGKSYLRLHFRSLPTRAELLEPTGSLRVSAWKCVLASLKPGNNNPEGRVSIRNSTEDTSRLDLTSDVFVGFFVVAISEFSHQNQTWQESWQWKYKSEGTKNCCILSDAFWHIWWT